MPRNIFGHNILNLIIDVRNLDGIIILLGMTKEVPPWYDLQINLAHELLVYYVCGKLDSLYKFSIDIYRC